MVSVGLTLVLPSTASVPLTPEILTEVASVVVQLSVVDSPSVTVVGVAVKESITQSHGLSTVTVTVSVASAVASLPSLAVSV